MAESLILNGNSSITKGTVIFEKGQPLQSTALILKGRVIVQGEGVRMTIGSGNFLGMCDVWKKEHSFTYVALDDLVLFGLPMENEKQAALLLEQKPQYRGLLVTSLNFFYHDVFRVFGKLKTETEKVAEFVHQTYSRYQKLAEGAGLTAEKIAAMERLLNQRMENYSLPEKITYFIQCSKIPIEAQKNYYGASAYVAQKQFEEQCAVLPQLVAGCRYYSDWLTRYFRIMITDEKNLFSLVGRMALGVRRSGQNDSELSVMLDHILEQINNTETLLLEYAGVNLHLDRQRMEETYFALLSDDTGSLDAFDQEDLKVLDHSVQQILDYAEVSDETAEKFASAVEAFLACCGHSVLMKQILRGKWGFEGYFTSDCWAIADFHLHHHVCDTPVESVTLAMKNGTDLNCGQMYGHLLTAYHEGKVTEEELRTLLTLPDSREEETTCRVYTMSEWLREIYEGRKNPSKDEFDTDYEETIRKQVHEKKLTKTEGDDAFHDAAKRLHFEVENLLSYADRILSGNISTFVPVMCSEGIYTKLESAVVTSAIINKIVNRVEKIDYSIFYRERMVAYEEVGLNRFTVTGRYTPEFIIFPVYGRKGLMWQDIEGRKKETHGRILLPSFMEQNLEAELLKMLAYFRWEKCRTEMGAQWNNYRYPSLTAEYTDYLQFFKKNNDLSPEKREKVKAQLTQCGNRHKDVFAKDYADWVLREATGAMKLNRVAREILFTYCPLAPQIAEGLLAQNAYRDAARRYMIEKGKREKEINQVLHRFEKAGMDLPEEVEQTRRFVLDLQGA